MSVKSILPYVLFMLLSTVLLAQDKADVVLLNGKIYTANELDQFAQAVAIRDSVILKVGSNTLIRTHVGDKTTVYNLNGKLVTPGFIDAHNHMVTAAETKILSMNLLPPEIQTIADIEDRIKAELEKTAG